MVAGSRAGCAVFGVPHWVAGVAAVTVPSHWNVEDPAASLEAASRACGFGLRRLDLAQDVWTWPRTLASTQPACRWAWGCASGSHAHEQVHLGYQSASTHRPILARLHATSTVGINPEVDRESHPSDRYRDAQRLGGYVTYEEGSEPAPHKAAEAKWSDQRPVDGAEKNEG